jgi:hypothetical protein
MGLFAFIKSPVSCQVVLCMLYFFYFLISACPTLLAYAQLLLFIITFRNFVHLFEVAKQGT